MLAPVRWISNQAAVLCPRCRRSPYRQFSYAQDGEDRILINIFAEGMRGFFVDVGAHHPKRFSNTYLLYERGWTGINIDPTPGVAKLFRDTRPLDVNLEIGITETAGEMTFHLYDEPAYNTFNEASHRQIEERGYPHLLEKRTVPTRPLRDVLAEHMPPGRSLDLLTIDAEGFDFQVLKSHDWDKFPPSLVLCEEGSTCEDTLDSAVGRFMREKGYVFKARTNNTCFFIRRGAKLR